MQNNHLYKNVKEMLDVWQLNNYCNLKCIFTKSICCKYDFLPAESHPTGSTSPPGVQYQAQQRQGSPDECLNIGGEGV